MYLVKDMKKKSFWKTDKCNLAYLSDKARRFFEESDETALEGLFGNCESIEVIENVANDLYDEIFG